MTHYRRFMDTFFQTIGSVPGRSCRVHSFCTICTYFLGFLFLAIPVRSVEETSSRTERQREILEELSAFRPPDDDTPGVWMLAAWNTDDGLEQLVIPPTVDANAAACFKRLEDLYPGEKNDLDANGHNLRGVDALLEAAEMKYCRFMPDYYPEFASMDTSQPDFQIMRLYLRALLRRAEVAEQGGNNALAERCYRAALLCGSHLTSDKPSSLVFVTGIIFKFRAAEAYGRFLIRGGQPVKGDAAKRFADRMSVFLRAFLWKANTALSEFEGFACLPSVLRIAREDNEVFWRKEAILRLANLRYGIPDHQTGSIRRNPAFEKEADIALAKAASEDSDPSARRLAVWVAINIQPPGYAEMEHHFEE